VVSSFARHRKTAEDSKKPWTVRPSRSAMVMVSAPLCLLRLNTQVALCTRATQSNQCKNKQMREQHIWLSHSTALDLCHHWIHLRAFVTLRSARKCYVERVGRFKWVFEINQQSMVVWNELFVTLIDIHKTGIFRSFLENSYGLGFQGG
jgi:hypothetical protein